MKRVEIVGANYFGKWDKTRTACRCIVINKDKMLLSYETLTDQWMIPGGGIEDEESEADCCVREVAEETGYLIKTSECLLEIDEYYENYKFISKYFIGEVLGTTKRNLTKREIAVGMEPRWISIKDIKHIFSLHDSYKDTNEMRRGMYLREYTALCELI